VKESYVSDAYCQKVISSLSTNANSVPHFTLLGGILRYKNRVWIGNSLELQHLILSVVHGSAIRGHSGFPITYRKLKQLFSWQGMKTDTHKFVQSCTICQQAKPNRSKYPRLLAPLPVPNGAWEVVTMNFIEGLPKSGNANCILVVVDKFLKYNHFIPLLHPFNAVVVAKAFLNNIYKLHSMPIAIISDRDKVFTSKFWQELFRLTNVTLQMSSSYYPQTDGQSERVNKCLVTYFRCFVHACPRQWIKWLPLAEFWYNTSYHSALGHSPFEVLYAQKPRHIGLQEKGMCQNQNLNKWLQERELMGALIK
jgi:hypothetical protein